MSHKILSKKMAGCEDVRSLQQVTIEALRELEAAELQVGEMVELLHDADDLYTNYGLICGRPDGIDGKYPIYDGAVGVGDWIGKVRKITRVTEKPKCDFTIIAGAGYPGVVQPCGEDLPCKRHTERRDLESLKCQKCGKLLPSPGWCGNPCVPF